MKIVNSICLCLFVVVTGTLVQSGHGYSEETASNSDIELLRSDIRTQKMKLISERMHLTNQEADTFWPIYRRYEVELATVNDHKIALMKDYLNHYASLDEPRTKQLAQGLIEVDQATVNLRKQFFGEFEKALTAKTAARWLQLERRLQVYLDAQLAKDVPAMAR